MTRPDGDEVRAGEEDRLFERLPDQDARDELVDRYQPLAGYLARRFAGRGESLEDLTQVAMIGLLNAVDRFDPERQVRFSTYATATIVGELKRHFRDRGWALRVPRRTQELAVRLGKTLEDLTRTLGRTPTIPEVAQHLDVGTDEIVDAMEAVQAYSTSSLETPSEGLDRAPIDTLGADDQRLEVAEDWAELAPALRRLPARERRVLYLRFFEGLTQSEIAGQIGVSQMHVSRILTRTLETLRERGDLSRRG